MKRMKERMEKKKNRIKKIMDYKEQNKNVVRLILLIKSKLFTSEELKELIDKNDLFFTFDELIKFVSECPYDYVKKKHLMLVITIMMNSWTPDWPIIHDIEKNIDWVPKKSLSKISDNYDCGKLIMVVVELGFDVVTPVLFEKYLRFFTDDKFKKWIGDYYLNYVKQNNISNSLSIINGFMIIHHKTLIINIVENGLDTLTSPLIDKFLRFTQIHNNNSEFQKWIIENGNIYEYLEYLETIVSNGLNEWFHPPKGDFIDPPRLLSYQWITRFNIIAKYINRPDIWEKMFMMMGKLAFNNEKFRKSNTFKICMSNLIERWTRKFVPKPENYKTRYNYLDNYKTLCNYLKNWNPIVLENMKLLNVIRSKKHTLIGTLKDFYVILQNINDYEEYECMQQYNKDLFEKKNILVPIEIIEKIKDMVTGTIETIVKIII
jgi:hypothetical protein